MTYGLYSKSSEQYCSFVTDQNLSRYALKILISLACNRKYYFDYDSLDIFNRSVESVLKTSLNDSFMSQMDISITF